ncbi:MAG: class I SAM-dependent methyltransferase [Candidatus Peribacteria bacterium]|nr:class I SAM-dependent methyltransferase [Candidatus Peribacteria bacterium]
MDKTQKNLRHKRKKGMKFISGDALEIPVEDNSFDFVFSTDMLEHIPREERLKSLQEATRVCSDTCIIGFPCGELAKLHDDFRFHYLDASEKPGRKTGRHDRVPEHYEQGLPREAEIDQLISQIEKEGHHVEKVWYNNILTWRDVIILEMKWLKRGYVGLCVLTAITRWYKIFGVPAHTEDQPGYRLFLIITKI